MGTIDDVQRGQELAQLRKSKNLTQRYVADRFKIDKSAVSEWERGRSRPGRDRLPILDEMYGADGAVLALFGFPSATAETPGGTLSDVSARLDLVERLGRAQALVVKQLAQELLGQLSDHDGLAASLVALERLLDRLPASEDPV